MEAWDSLSEDTTAYVVRSTCDSVAVLFRQPQRVLTSDHWWSDNTLAPDDLPLDVIDQSHQGPTQRSDPLCDHCYIL